MFVIVPVLKANLQLRLPCAGRDDQLRQVFRTTRKTGRKNQRGDSCWSSRLRIRFLSWRFALWLSGRQCFVVALRDRLLLRSCFFFGLKSPRWLRPRARLEL